MNYDMVWGVVRTLLAAVGGYYASKGKLSPDDANTIIGAVGTLGAGVWSIFSKRGK